MKPRAPQSSIRPPYSETSRLETSTTSQPAPVGEQPEGDLEAVHVGELHVQEHDLGPEPGDALQRGGAVLRLADDLVAL